MAKALFGIKCGKEYNDDKGNKGINKLKISYPWRRLIILKS